MQIQFPSAVNRKKRSQLQELLEAGWVMVHVVPGGPGVELPDGVHGQLAVALNLGASLPDLELGHDAVSVTLSFGGVRARCVLPWEAIYSLRSHATEAQFVYPDDAPQRLRDHLTRARRSAEREVPPAESSGEPESAPADDSAPRPRPTLRLVDP